MTFYRTMISIILLTTLLITGCAPRTSTHSQQFSANDYLEMAANAEDFSQNDWLLKAIDRYIDSRQLHNAQKLISSTSNNELLPQQRIDLTLDQAQVYVLIHQNTNALNTLKKVNRDESMLSKPQHIKLLRLLAKAEEQQGNIISSINQRTQLLPLLHDKEKKQTLFNIWLSLQTLSPKEKTTILNDSDSSYLQGWITLNTIIHTTHSNQSINQQLASWKNNFPSHPASQLLPTHIESKTTHDTPNHIALLLPLTGPLKEQAQAIRNGFFTAYYSWKKDEAHPPTISVYDTYNKNINTVYKDAIKKGADFVVGPLAKNNIEKLIHSNTISIPTIALNTTSKNPQYNYNLYQYGLSPNDEIIQLTDKAIQSQHTHALIIAPKSAWGDDIVEKIKTQWTDQGGDIRGTMQYQNQNTLSANIKELLKIQASYNRGYAIRRILGLKNVRIISRRRQDFNIIILVSQPAMARQIQPLLKFYFAGDIPTYSLSTIYDGIPNADRDKDLNNILFCDIPWVLKPQAMHPTTLNTLQQQIQSLWKDSYQTNTKLYALGIDAFSLTTNLHTMVLLPDFGIKGATGALYLDTNNHIYRQLPWAQFSYGVPKLRS